MKVDMRLEGVEDTFKLLSKVAPRQARNIMRATVHGVAGEVRDEIRRDAPTDGPPRVLAPAFKTRRRRGSPTVVASAVIVERRAFFWRFLEFGTSKIAARPYVAPVVERMAGQFRGIYLRVFKAKLIAAIERARKRQQAR